MSILFVILFKTFIFRSSHQRCSLRKCVLRNFAKFAGKHLCQSLFFNKVAGLSKKDTLTQVKSFENIVPGCHLPLINYQNFCVKIILPSLLFSCVSRCISPSSPNIESTVLANSLSCLCL